MLSLSGPQKSEDKSKGSKVQTVVSHDQDNNPPGGGSWSALMASQNDLFKQLKSQGEQIIMLSKQVQSLASSSAPQSREQLNNLPSSKKQVKCFGCGEADHILPKCPHKKNDKNKTDTANRMVRVTGPKSDSGGVSTISGALFIHACINGRRYPCLVDTGSEVTIINESLVRADEIRESTRTLRAANGSSIRVAGVVEFPLFLGRHQFQSSFIVSPQVQNVILGLDWLELHGCLIDCKNLTLIIGDNRFKLHHMNTENMCRKIEASHDIILPGRSQVNVEARVVLPHLRNSGESWMTEGLDQEGDWQLAHSVVSGVEEMVPIRLLNTTESPVVIPKGQEIGSLVEVEVPTPSTQGIEISDVEQERVLLDMIARVDDSVSTQDKQKLKSLLLKYKGATFME